MLYSDRAKQPLRAIAFYLTQMGFAEKDHFGAMPRLLSLQPRGLCRRTLRLMSSYAAAYVVVRCGLCRRTLRLGRLM